MRREQCEYFGRQLEYIYSIYFFSELILTVMLYTGRRGDLGGGEDLGFFEALRWGLIFFTVWETLS